MPRSAQKLAAKTNSQLFSPINGRLIHFSIIICKDEIQYAVVAERTPFRIYNHLENGIKLNTYIQIFLIGPALQHEFVLIL